MINPLIVPVEFRVNVGLNGETASQRISPNDETIVSDHAEILRESSPTGAASTQQSPAENVMLEPSKDGDKDTGARTKDKSRSHEASATSTPRSGADLLQQNSEDRDERARELGQLLDSLDEWKQ